MIAGIRRGERVAVAGIVAGQGTPSALERVVRSLVAEHAGRHSDAKAPSCDLVLVAVPAGRAGDVLRACGKHLGSHPAGDVALEYHLDSEHVTDHQWLGLIEVVDDRAGEVAIAWPRQPGDPVYIHAGERTLSIPAEPPA